MYKYLAAAAFLLAAYAPAQLSAVNLILATQQGDCVLQLQSNSNVNVDPATGDVRATIASGSTCPEVAGNATLTVTKNGSGSGTVSSSPMGINCGGTCSASFPAGSTVTLTASAGSGSAFAGWSGAGCTGTGNCVVTMSQSREVTATFNAATTFTLTVNRNGTGTGTVMSSPTGINCGTSCSSNFTLGTNVQLTATPASGSTFAGWSGEGCTGTGSCTVSMSQARTVTATFNTSGSVAGCEGVAPPAPYTRATSTRIKISTTNHTVNATLFSEIFRAAGGPVDWPGNTNNPRYITIDTTRYIAAGFVPDMSKEFWEISGADGSTEAIAPAMMSISRCPGDFRTDGVALDSRCIFPFPDVFRSMLLRTVTSLPFPSGSRCPVLAGETYYFNMIFANPYDNYTPSPVTPPPNCDGRSGGSACAWLVTPR